MECNEGNVRDKIKMVKMIDMKIIKTFILSLYLTISIQLFAQKTEQKLLMIEILQSSNYPCNEIIVTENSAKIEEVSLNKWNTQHLDSNQITVNKTIAKYMLLGYKLISSVRGSLVTPTNDTIMVTTYLFVKEESY